MKAVVLLFAFVAGIWAATLPETEIAHLKHVHDRCQANPATHADEDLIRDMMHHSHDPKVRAHMMCMAKGVGMMTETGTLKMDVIKSKMSMVMDDEHQVATMMTKCAVQKDNPMTTAMDMWMCFMQNHVGYMHHV